MTLHADSYNAHLATLQPGQGFLIPTTLEDYARVMRTVNTPKSRRPKELRGREFSSTLFTCVSARKAGDVRYVVWIERTA